jgi:hypothetical protein
VDYWVTLVPSFSNSSQMHFGAVIAPLIQKADEVGGMGIFEKAHAR